jgi:hypothetical protein
MSDHRKNPEVSSRVWIIDMFMVHVEKTEKDGETTCAKFSLHQV